MKLTKEEIQFLLNLLNQISVSGIEAKEMIVQIMRKLQDANE